MAGRSAVLSIRIIADGKQAGKEFQNVNSEVAKFDDGLRKASAVSAVAVAGIGALAVAAGNSASNLQQATGAVESVYGAHASVVKRLAEDAADNVGLAESQYMQMSSVVASQLKNMGVPMSEVTGQTEDLITKAADLAATFGGSTSDAVGALSSLLRGERDPIERYGVSIKQADINSRLAAMGMADLEGEAAKAAETQAVLALLTEQTAAANGQFAREADTAAGAQQRATAEWENAQAQLGEALLPVMVILAEQLAGIATWVSENTELVMVITGVVGGFAAAILIANGAITAYRTIAAIATAAQIGWNVAMSANPIGVVVMAIAALVGAIVWLIANWEEVARVAADVWEGIIGWIEGAVGWVGELVGGIGELFGATGGDRSRSGGSSFDDAAAASAVASSSGVDAGPGAAAWSTPTQSIREGDKYDIRVEGAVDVDGTARTLEKVLAKHGDRVGRKPGDSEWR